MVDRTLLRHLPNLITLLRIAMVPAIFALLLAQQFEAALWLVLVAGGSDALDGFLAKHFGWQSRLGSLLDPIADKLLLLGCFIGLWWTGQVPTWLLALVIGRDLVIVAGAVTFHLLIRPLSGEPTLLGKLATFLQIGLVLLWLLHLAWWPQLQPWIEPAMLLTAALIVLSGIDYIVRWAHRALAVRRDRRG